MKVYIEKDERWPDFFVTADEEYSASGVSALVDEATLARWEHAERLYNEAQDEIRALFEAGESA